VLTAAVLLAGCGLWDEEAAPPEPGPTTTTSPPDDDAPTEATGPPTPPPQTEPGAWADLAFALVEIAAIPEAVSLTPRSGSLDLYVAERSGRIWRLLRTVNQATLEERWEVDPRPVLDLRDTVTTDSERGLLGLAYSSDGRTLYVSYTDQDGHSVLEAMEVGEAAVDEASRRVLLRQEQPFGNHNGGHVALGPDGFVYWGLGDGGGAGDPLDAGQDPTTWLGSVLRIDAFPRGDQPYGVPDGNPFADGGDGAPEVWLWGVRNPWRFSFDRATGDLWLADVGQNRFEEINLLRADEDERGRGANLGWNRMEGFEPFDGATEPPDHHPPVFAYAHEEGRCGVIGGHVFRGEFFGDLDGVYVYGDLCTGEIRGLQVLDDGRVLEAPLSVRAERGSLVSFGEDLNGSIYVLELSGRVSRLVLAPDHTDQG
jgi:glucose/arabinose dehydrogenase